MVSRASWTRPIAFSVLAGALDVLCLSKNWIEGVLADYPNGRHGRLHPPAAIVGIHEHQVRFDLVSGDDIPLGHPDFAAILQGTGSLIGDAFARKAAVSVFAGRCGV